MEKAMKYVLFNPCSGNGECEKKAHSYAKELNQEYKILNMTQIKSYSDLFSGLAENDDIVLFGGDGTLNRFVNDTSDLQFNNPVFYYPAGTGNDFYADIKGESEELPVSVNKYINKLPTVNVKGKNYKFINGIGYGIDGYCCEVGDKLHAEGKPANYTSIAIKGLLFHYKPTNAKITVDGKEYNYKKVWIAPTMNGRRYGGGMIPTPAQNRCEEDKKLSLMVFHGSGKLKTLMIFPSIFKGEHVKKEKYVTVFTGKEITVKFDAPRALQIDGETILGVEEYSAKV